MRNFANQPTLRRGLAFIRLLLFLPVAYFLLFASGALRQRAQDASYALAEPRPQLHIPGPPLPFLGITVALEQDSAADRQLALARLAALGFGWVRQRLDWGLLEPHPGQYDWRLSDALLQEIGAAGLVPVVVLDGSPTWARAAKDIGATANPFAPPADPATFAHFVAAFATRYQAKLRFYQIWDEPNVAPHWGNRLVEPVAYAQLLKAAAMAIRAADADAVIISAALAPTRDRGHLAIDEIYFLQRLYAAGAAPYFDVVAAQPFGFGYGPDDARARPPVLNFQRVKLMRRAMLAAGDGATPIWAVRYGWNIRTDSPWRTVQPADQLAFATAALTLARQQWPWLTAMGWAIDQPAQPSADPSWGFALTPALAAALHDWQTDPARDPAVTTALAPTWWHWLALATLWGLLLWRTTTALVILPWSTWRQRYCAWPVWVQGGAWLLLALLYYFVTWPPLIILCWIGAILLLLPNPSIGVGLVAFLLPFYFQHKEIVLAGYTATIPPAHAALFCLAVALLASRGATVAGKYRGQLCGLAQQFHCFDWLALLWVVISLLTSLNVWHWPAYGQSLCSLVLLPCLAYTTTRLLATTPDRRTALLMALFAGGLGAALVGLPPWWQGEGTAADGVLRLVGPYFSPNHMALYLERTGWLGLGLALQQQGAWRRWLLGATALVGLALFLTASRGAWLLGLPTGALVLGWAAGCLQRVNFARLYHASRRALAVGSSAAVLTGIVLGLAILNPLWTRLTNSATVTERLTIWQATWQLWQEHWWLGVGPGGFIWRYPSYLPWSTDADPNLLHPHNLWLELVAGWGVLGLGWFLLVVWQLGRMLYTVKNQASARRPWQLLGTFAALAAGMAHGQVDTFAALPDLAVWNWLALGLLVNGWQAYREKEIETAKI